MPLTSILRKSLRRLRSALPTTLLLLALATALAGHFRLRLRIGNPGTSLIISTLPFDFGFRYFHDPAPALPADPPFLRISREFPIPPGVDAFPPEFDPPLPEFWSIDHPRAFYFDLFDIHFAAGPPLTAPTAHSVYLLLPLWLPLSLTAALFLTQQLRLLCTYRRPLPLTCPNCSYDLRASPLRCPECGTPTPTATPLPRPPVLLRLPRYFDTLLRSHPATSLAAAFLTTLLLAITLSPTTSLSPDDPFTPIPALPLSQWPPTTPITILYPIHTLLTSPTSPLHGPREDRLQQLTDQITAVDLETWATHGGELPAPLLFNDTLLLSAPSTTHQSLQPLLPSP